ncbi:hypothetical protein [Pseudomonas typographi]|nr:hypothetical protein [Pseudomonas typographi]MBD1551177.1 hypothetical protein [Pseudomonas typographi]MBD1586329.1 hypothetical protein [Pseudomonas typographi]
MRKMPIEQLGTAAWKMARTRQERAFARWHDYLQRQANSRARPEPLKLAG